MSDPRDELYESLPPRERAIVLLRERIVCEINAMIDEGKELGFRANDLIKTFAIVLRGRGFKVSASTISHWRMRRRYDGFAGLIDRRVKRPASIDELDAKYPEFFKLFFEALETFRDGNTWRQATDLAFWTARHRSQQAGEALCSRQDAMRRLRAYAIKKGTDRSGFDAGSIDN